jgi:hypothetical protein
MPTQAGIHDFAARRKETRVWRAFARHDDERGRQVNLFGDWKNLQAGAAGAAPTLY